MSEEPATASQSPTMKSLLTLLAFCVLTGLASAADTKPHIIFVMADDMGWGQTGYRGHPVLKTPNLDAMAANGLRFERFYAGGPVCSPTRAAMLTGRSHERAGVLTHGYALRTQEKTIAQALKGAGYVTGHFGKWHLNGHKGPGAPIFADDPRGPGAFGFDEWVSVSNFYDVDPLMSRAGKFEQMKGDSSEIAVAEAVKFLGKHKAGGKPMFAVVWYGTPHSPFKALDADKAAFGGLNEASANHYGELVAMDRSIGTLRAKLRDLGLAQNTMLVFCSDNGGLPGITPETVGGLRGNKGSVFEGGIRVPGIIRWPGKVPAGKIDDASVVAGVDWLPTVCHFAGVKLPTTHRPDGEIMADVFQGQSRARTTPLLWEWRFRIAGEPFHHSPQLAIREGDWKLLLNPDRSRVELYDLKRDLTQLNNLAEKQPDLVARLSEKALAWSKDLPPGPRDPGAGQMNAPLPGQPKAAANPNAGKGKKKAQ